MIAAAGERPLPVQHITVVFRHSSSGRGEAGAGERVVPATPQFALCLDREMAERNAVGEGAIERPSGRRASPRHDQRDLERDRGVVFEPAELLWPAGPQQFRIADLGDYVRRDGAVALGLFGQFPDLGHHRLGAGDEFFRAGRCDKANGGTRHGPLQGIFRARSGCLRSEIATSGNPARGAFGVDGGAKKADSPNMILLPG
jgi:hypothetical protein